MHDKYLVHHGILGQKWGVRRFQNEDGSLTERGKKRLQKKDLRWAKRNENRITNKTFNKSKKEIKRYQRKVLDKSYSDKGRTYMNAYNQKLAEVMTDKVSKYKAPSGRAVKFVAKRGEYGVYMAIAGENYDMSKVKNGIWANGKVAYRNQNVSMAR